MKAVLLAAGEGTRLRPLTLTIPKCMVPINGKPLIDYWLEMLVPCDEIDEIFINICYLKEIVTKHIQDNWSHSDKITLWYEEKLLGTAGTLKANFKMINGDDIMVVHADNLSVFSLPEFISAYYRRPPYIDACMMLFETDTPSQCGIVELNENNLVIAMHEKISQPPSNLANGAVYIFSTDTINWINQHPVFDISNDVIPQLLGRILGWKNQQYHRDIGTPESYRNACNRSI